MGVRFVSNIIQNTKLATVWSVLFVAACASDPTPIQPSSPQAQVRTPAPSAPAFMGCANSGDMHAVKAAAIGQRLMVASYACQAKRPYQEFIAVYRDEMRTSDIALQDFFHRLDSEAGERAVDTFKTRLANSAMLDSLADTKGFCASTQQTFSAAMSLPSKKLDLFLLTQDFPLTEKVSPCNIVASR